MKKAQAKAKVEMEKQKKIIANMTKEQKEAKFKEEFKKTLENLKKV